MQPLRESAAEPVQVALDPMTSSEHKQSSHFATYRSSTCVDDTQSQRKGVRKRKFIRDLLKESKSSQVGRLTVIDFCEAQNLEFDQSGRRAIGVWVRHAETGSIECLRSSNGGEIVLCAGVFESPRLLRTSVERQRGAVWKSVSMNQKEVATDTTKVPSLLEGTVWDPAVLDLLGSSLQDHLLVPLMFLTTKPWTNPTENRSSSSSNRGNDSGPSNGIHGWVYLDDEGCPTDLHSSQAIPRYHAIIY